MSNKETHMRLEGRITGVNSSKTQIYIKVLDFGTYTVFKCSIEELDIHLLNKLRDGNITGTSVIFDGHYEGKKNTAHNVQRSFCAAYSINEAAMDIISELMTLTNSALLEPPVLLEEGKFQVRFKFQGREVSSTVTWKTRPRKVIRYLEYNT